MEANEIDTDTAKIKELEKQLEEAREQAFSKTKELKIGVSKNKEGNQQLDIVKNFPTQMDKFTRIVEPLTKSTVDKKLDKALEEISSKLDLEYDKLKGFFRVTEEKNKMIIIILLVSETLKRLLVFYQKLNLTILT